MSDWLNDYRAGQVIPAPKESEAADAAAIRMWAYDRVRDHYGKHTDYAEIANAAQALTAWVVNGGTFDMDGMDRQGEAPGSITPCDKWGKPL